MKFNPKVGDLVELEWIDHWSYPQGWHTLTDIPDKPVICRTIGYIIKLTQQLIVVANTFDKDSEHLSGVHGRLRNCITKARVIKAMK